MSLCAVTVAASAHDWRDQSGMQHIKPSLLSKIVSMPSESPNHNSETSLF
jgi:hypothetical protein